jgi:hypothetical protein
VFVFGGRLDPDATHFRELCFGGFDAAGGHLQRAKKHLNA